MLIYQTCISTMINYVYLEFWKMNMKNIQSTEKQIKTNLDEYMRTKDTKYIQFLSENIEELMRLKQKIKKYYNKIFNQF